MSESPLDEVLAALPIEYQERFAAAVARPREPSRMREAIDEYVATIRKVSAWVVALDPRTAERLGQVCHALLDRFEQGPHAALVHGTVTYFLEEEEDDEVTGVLGFDDDTQVINIVCRVLGADDLVQPLPRRYSGSPGPR